MLKTELEDQLYSHSKFSVDRLHQIADGAALTKSILWQYLCELEGWRSLEVLPSNKPDWFLVASSSEIGLWHRASVMYQACDCQRVPTGKPCCHLSAAMAQEENRWIERAESYGFNVSVVNGDYQIIDKVTGLHVGELHFEEGDRRWLLLEDRNQLPMHFDGVTDAIEYLAAVASFGWQLA